MKINYLEGPTLIVDSMIIMDWFVMDDKGKEASEAFFEFP